MDNRINASVLGLLLAGLACGAETPAPADTSAQALSARNLEIGGLVTLDQESRLGGDEDPALGLGEVALGANVTLGPEIRASVVLMAEQDLEHLFFDQAVAEVKPAGKDITFLFGQQTFSHGLLTTRLISDPEILPALEINQPGLAAIWTRGDLAAGGALALWESEVDGGMSRDYAFLPHADFTHGPVMARASGMVSRHKSDAGVAATLSLGPVSVDLEGFLPLQVWDAEDKAGGWMVGAEWALNGSFALATRFDGLARDGFRGLPVFRHGYGATWTLKDDLFAAVEYSDGRGGESSGRRIALQVGLKSTLNLPGFQRATLTQD